MVFFQKVKFEKNQQAIKKHEKLPSRQWLKLLPCHFCGMKTVPVKIVL